MEHALHLSVGHLVKELGLKPLNASRDESGQDGSADEEDLLGSDVSHALNKALGLTKQVQSKAYPLETMTNIVIRSGCLHKHVHSSNLHAYR